MTNSRYEMNSSIALVQRINSAPYRTTVYRAIYSPLIIPVLINIIMLGKGHIDIGLFNTMRFTTESAQKASKRHQSHIEYLTHKHPSGSYNTQKEVLGLSKQVNLKQGSTRVYFPA